MDIELAKKRARSGQLLLLARRMLALVITFASTVTIARLVAPEAYGLANMAIVLLAFAQVFRDFGLTKAVLRKKVISAEEISFIFWFNAAATVVLAVIVAALAPWAGEFYNEPIVQPIILVSLIGFLASGMAGQHRALLERELRFGSIAMAESVSLLAGFGVTLVLAIIYHNVWAIVIGTLAQSLSSSALLVWQSGWKPGRPRKLENPGSVLKFGMDTSIFSVSVFLSNNVPTLLIGHYLGASLLGQYNRADALYRMPAKNLVQPITQAIMPLLTQLQDNADEYREAYLGLIRKLCTVLVPISVTLTFAAVPLISALLGPQWDLAGHVFAMLAPTMAAVAIAYAAGDLFITQDRASELKTVGIIETIIRVGAIIIGVQYGLVATAFAYMVSTMLAALVRTYFAGRKGPVTMLHHFQAGIPCVPMALASGAGCLAVQEFVIMPSWSSVASAAVLIGTGAAAAIITGLSLPASRAAIKEVVDILGLGRVRKILRAKFL